jgi:hypothetical protein
MDTGNQGAHGQNMDIERAGGVRRSGSWRGRDVALAVGLSAQLERRPGARVVEIGRVGWASPSRRGLKPVSNKAGPH